MNNYILSIMFNYQFCMSCGDKITIYQPKNIKTYGVVCENTNYNNNKFICCGKFYCTQCVEKLKQKSIYGDYFHCYFCDKHINII